MSLSELVDILAFNCIVVPLPRFFRNPVPPFVLLGSGLGLETLTCKLMFCPVFLRQYVVYDAYLGLISFTGYGFGCFTFSENSLDGFQFRFKKGFL